MCHCYDCRHITGMLACDFVRLPPLDENLFDESAVPAGLSMYKTPGGHVGWYFCDKCGAHVVQSSSRDGGKTTTWLFSLGTLYPLALDDGTPTSTLKYHSYVNYGEHQGGLSRFLPDGMPRYVDNSESVPASQDTKPTAEQEAEIVRASAAPTLPLACHCGKVQLRLHRPASGPIEDKFVRTARGERWLWTLCLCHSCRTTAGFDATPFLFVPYSHLTSGKPDQHPTTGLTRYTGYPGRNRYFCPTCGACALFEDIERGALYDIYLGLVDAPVRMSECVATMKGPGLTTLFLPASWPLSLHPGDTSRSSYRTGHTPRIRRWQTFLPKATRPA